MDSIYSVQVKRDKLGQCPISKKSVDCCGHIGAPSHSQGPRFAEEDVITQYSSGELSISIFLDTFYRRVFYPRIKCHYC
jgi:hypothetical protein